MTTDPSRRDAPTITVTAGRHDVVWLRAGALRLGAVPALGGRLLSIRRNGRELLWRNPELLDDDLQPVPGHVPAPTAGTMGDWNNYGGDKTWPAPQGWSSPQEWAGPPDPVLDSGSYRYAIDQSDDEVAVTMTSDPDPRTGLRLSRRIALRDDRGFTLELGAQNTTDADVTWALWNVTQLDGGGTVTVGVDERFTEPVELAIGTGAPQWQHHGDSVTVEPQDVVGKLGFPHATGRLSYRHEDIDVRWSFDVDDTADYPDHGSRVEVWLEHPQPAPLATLDGLDPPARIVECEMLSPSRTLTPDQTMALAVRVDLTVDEPSAGEARP